MLKKYTEDDFQEYYRAIWRVGKGELRESRKI